MGKKTGERSFAARGSATMDWWKKLLLYAGGAAGAAATLYYLLREDTETSTRSVLLPEERDEQKKLRPEDVTKEQVQRILSEIVESQEIVRAEMKQITKELLQQPMSFDVVYQRMNQVKPPDPLERFGLSTMEFDDLLTPYHKDPQIREGIARIMGSTTATGDGVEGPPVSLKKVVEVHEFMLEELKKLVEYVSASNSKDSWSPKIVTLAGQAVVAAKVEERFGLTSEDIEVAVIKHQKQLAKDQEFANVNRKLQETMGLLMELDGR